MNDTQMDPNGTAFVPTGRPNNEHLWRLTRNLLDLQKSGKFCDVQLLCQDGSLSAHSVVLASACDSLHATIQHQHMHLPMMEYSLETVQRMVTYLYTGYIDPPPPHEEISFQNLMDSMGLPHTQPDDIEDLVSPSVYPVTSPARIDQDIKPQLVAGEPIEPNQLRKRLPKNLEPVVSLVQLNLDTFESDNEEEPDDEIPEINIKQEIESDDEPSTSLETQTPETQHFTNRGRKRKAVYDDDYDYAENDDRDYIPRQSSSSKRKSTPKRAYTAKARKSMGSRKPMNIDSIPKSEDPDEDADEQYGESFTEGESYVEGDSFGLAEQKPLVPKPKKKIETRTRLCKICNEYFKDVVEHRKIAHGDMEIRQKYKVRECPVCGFRGYQLTMFKYHMMVEHNITSFGTVDIFRCEDCDFETCFRWAYVKHKKESHGKIADNALVGSPYQKTSGTLTRCRTVKCKHCGEVVDDIIAHKEEKHADVREKSKIRICPTCGYRAHQLTTFVYHMMVEHNDMSHGTVDIYKCQDCDFQSCFEGSVLRHAKTVHERIKEYYIDKNTKAEEAAQHVVKIQLDLEGDVSNMSSPKDTSEMRRDSSEGFSFPRKKRERREKKERVKTMCEVCGQAVYDVKMHVKRMHGETKWIPKTYICPTCGWQTKDSGCFKFHMMMKHKDTSQGTVKIYKCEHCGYEHYSKHVIKNHVKYVHEKIKDYQCDICGHQVRTKNALIGHKLSHSEEGRQSLKCPHCTYATCWPNDLSRHIDRKHTDSVVRLPCSICGTFLKGRDVLKLHLRNKHGLSIEEATAVMKVNNGVNSDPIPTKQSDSYPTQQSETFPTQHSDSFPPQYVEPYPPQQADPYSTQGHTAQT